MIEQRLSDAADQDRFAGGGLRFFKPEAPRRHASFAMNEIEDLLKDQERVTPGIVANIVDDREGSSGRHDLHVVGAPRARKS